MPIYDFADGVLRKTKFCVEFMKIEGRADPFKVLDIKADCLKSGYSVFMLHRGPLKFCSTPWTCEGVVDFLIGQQMRELVV